MIENYTVHNLFFKDINQFEEHDPHLENLQNLKFVHPLDWWKDIDWAKPGIYILTGGRQIGKSTSAKLLIKKVLRDKQFKPTRVFYLPCDQISDHLHLTKIIKLFVEEDLKSLADPFLLILDEITYVKDWDKSIKALADEALFRNGFCFITGSDSVILKEAASRFPGRRGNADVSDFHIHPLNFHEYVKLTSPDLLEDPENRIASLFESFEFFQKSGGYLKAINDLYLYGEIKQATYLMFEQWICGDFERRGKNLQTLASVLAAVCRTYGSQITYSTLAQKMGHVSKETLIDYMNLLERMDILFSLQAFDQNTGLGFPKKAKRIHFYDPFIIDTIERWLASERLIEKKDRPSLKVESIAAANYKRAMPTYYIKAEGEIDLVLVAGKIFVPIEVKWTNQLRPNDLKQLAKYERSIILTKGLSCGHVDGIRSIPLPLCLIKYPREIPALA
ncbi:MAG TPA: ATP-binding protein [bacterium]|nr:ATP-binding protein [bacterium]